MRIDIYIHITCTRQSVIVEAPLESGSTFSSLGDFEIAFNREGLRIICKSATGLDAVLHTTVLTWRSFVSLPTVNTGSGASCFMMINYR